MKLKEIHSRNNVYLTGSRETIKRSIREYDNGKYYIIFYGQLIEVRKGNGIYSDDYFTVLKY